MLGPFAIAVMALLSAGIIDTIYLGNLTGLECGGGDIIRAFCDVLCCHPHRSIFSAQRARRGKWPAVIS